MSIKKLSRKEYEQLKTCAKELSEQQPRLRIGQCLFNLLHRTNPNLANSVRGGIADPFYAADLSDERILAFEKQIVE
jgi:hypothetical protein